ncbi:MAG TPA: hypothetical protein PLA82_09830 [Deltaproteobacteria bacterium]|nr:hypothetical protein [Deltaproteobacteria bacterium]
MTPYVLTEQEDWFENEITYICPESPASGNAGGRYRCELWALTLAASRLVGSTGKGCGHLNLPARQPHICEKAYRSNQMTNIELVQARLSDRKGTAMIALNPNSELNAVTELIDPDGRYETIELTSLDECETVYGWEDIEFVKLDAEKQERNIIQGGRCFLSAHSPLIMFEFKHGNQISTELIDDFSALRYRPYRLVPGLGILAPIGPGYLARFVSAQPFLLQARPGVLEDKELLYTREAVPPHTQDPTVWRQKLERMPCFKTDAGPTGVRRKICSGPVRAWREAGIPQLHRPCSETARIRAGNHALRTLPPCLREV